MREVGGERPVKSCYACSNSKKCLNILVKTGKMDCFLEHEKEGRFDWLEFDDVLKIWLGAMYVMILGVITTVVR